MYSKRLLSVGDFAKKTQTTLATLHHYDTIGLLSPVFREDNGYRYYSLTQLSEVNIIRVFQKSGMSLSQIKHIKSKRTPEITIHLLEAQMEKITEEIDDLISSRKLMATISDLILSAQDAEEDTMVIQYLPAKPIILGKRNLYSKDEDGFDALPRFYDYIAENYHKNDLYYPVWAIFSPEDLKIKTSGEHTWPVRYFFYTLDGDSERPAGFYAIGYARGGYGENDDIYPRMKKFINKNGFEICGNAYEEYPLNELSIIDSTKYLMRVMIQVQKKEA